MMAAIMAVMLAVNTGVSVFAGNSAEYNANGTAADYTLSSPRIKPATAAGQKVTYDCVWFGSYPQTEVKEDDSAYALLQAATGWDANNDIVIDGTKYRRMQKGDATYATSGDSDYYDWEDGTTYHYFRCEPVKWRVLETDGSTAMLLSDVALDDQMYNTENIDTTWETSTIRSWLNGYGPGDNQESTDYSSRNFIDSAFSKAEQDAIVITNVVNDDNIEYATEGGNDTSDKLFLLSEKEIYTETAAVHGFVSDYDTYDEARRCKSSDYAKAMGVESENDEKYKGNCKWWLRSPGYAGDDAVNVHQDGYVSRNGYNGDNVNDNKRGVRVALNLNLSLPNLYTYAGVVCSFGKGNEAEGNEDFSLDNPRIEKDGNKGMVSEQRATYDCVWFGSYPQTEVKSHDSVYALLQSTTGWDVNNDIIINGTKYRKVRNDGTTYRYFRYEPVKWRVLETDGSTAMLLSDVALDVQMHNTECRNTTWETSTIRSWLNGYGAGDNQQSTDYSSRNFIDSAFITAEQSAIVTTDVANDDNIYWETEGGNDTTDKIFLLSEKEVYTETAAVHGFVSDCSTITDDEARMCNSSDYAKAKGLWSDYKGHCRWWLRSPGDSGDNAVKVGNSGSVGSSGLNVDDVNTGVRVALNLNLASSNLYTYAGTVCTDGTVNETAPPTPEPLPSTTKIKLNTTAKTMLAGGRLTLKAKVTTDAKGIKVKWSSSDSKVASVTSKGTVTANKKGTAKITAATTDGKKATCKITVKAAPKSIKLNRTKLTLKKGKTFNLKYTITKNTYTTVTYKTSSKKVATVSSSGKVTAKKKGTAVITAATLNGKTAKCKVTVK